MILLGVKVILSRCMWNPNYGTRNLEFVCDTHNNFWAVLIIGGLFLYVPFET